MPRPRNNGVEVTAHQAQYIVERLQRAGHLTASHIRHYLAELLEEIKGIEDRLQHLREVHTPVAESRRNRTHRGVERSASSQAIGTRPSAKQVRKKRKFTVTAKVLASREIQGRYLPLLNKFTGRRRAEYARMAKKRGREAAIAAMEAALRS